MSLEQSTSPPVNANLDAAPQEAERNHDDKRRRIDEPVSPVSTVAQDKVWEQAISKLKERSTFHVWSLGSGKGKIL